MDRSRIQKAPNRTSFTEIAPFVSPPRAPVVLLAVSGAASVLPARIWHCCAVVQDRAHHLPKQSPSCSPLSLSILLLPWFCTSPLCNLQFSDCAVACSTFLF
ncbi:hypothetical protein ACSQ67_001071 [Phaseolus vulgaris]